MAAALKWLINQKLWGTVIIAETKNVCSGEGDGFDWVAVNQDRIVHVETLQEADFRRLGNRVRQGVGNLECERGRCATKALNVWQVVQLAGTTVKLHT